MLKSPPKIPKTTRANFVQGILNLDGSPYSLADYPHMILPYNINPDEMVLHFSRQCVWENQELNLSNGKPILAKDLKPGQYINSFDEKTLLTLPAKVKDVWSNGVRPVYQVKTRTGREFNVTGNHPIWTAFGWKDTGELKKGDLIGLAKTNHRSLTQNKTVEDWEYKIAAYLLAEGSLGSSGASIRFTTGNPQAASELDSAVKEFNPLIFVKKSSAAYAYTVKGLGSGKPHPLKKWLISNGMWGHKSATKFHPDFIWNLTKEQLKDYLRIWWETDGYVSTSKNGHYYIGIGLISRALIKGIQELLLKLGIHSTIKTQKPKVYKNTNKFVYVLQLEGNDSKELFFNNIKTYKNPSKFYFKESNNNRLVVDAKFINEQLDKIPYNYKHNEVLYKTQGYAGYTFTKLKRMVSVHPIPEIQKILDSDIIFDKVKSIKMIGEFETKAIEIEGTNTFQINDIVSHNTAKSTTLAGRMVGDAIATKHLRLMYISPTVDQTKLFSNDRIKPFIETSDFIKKYYVDSRLTQNVFTKEFKNFSKIYLRYALHDADKLRGFSIDKLMFDEVQDLRAGIIDVVSETMSRSKYKNVIYTGTPKRSKGTLADIWQRSTKNEFVIKCEACGHWNVLDDSNIGKEGVICSKCGSDKMFLKNGQWASTYSMSANPSTEGFRICALHFAKAPWVNWEKDIIHKMETRSQQIFFNETLALEYDGGTVPIKKEELYAASNRSVRMSKTPTVLDASYSSVAGIDYGPANSEASNTVMVVVQRRPGFYYIPYAKKFIGKEAEFAVIHEEVPKLMDKWKAQIIAADYGMGEASNAEIRKQIGKDRLVAFQHVNAQKERARWNNKLGAYTLNRTESMTLIFNALKAGKIRFVSPMDMDPFFEDILNIYSEYDDEIGTMRYINAGPDDFFHAMLYAIFASDMQEGNTMLFEI